MQSRQLFVDYAEAEAGISFKNNNGLEDYMQLKRDVFGLIQVVNDGGEGGATTFAELTDTSSGYAGNAGFFVVVNNSENGLVFEQVAPQANVTTEAVPLADGQTVVTFATVNANRSQIFRAGNDVDSGLLLVGVDYVVNSSTQITLTNSEPSGARIVANQTVVTV